MSVTVFSTSEESETEALPTRGALGSLSAQAFLGVLASQTASGTLYLGREGAAALLSLQDGKPRARTDFGVADGAVFDLEADGAQFSFWPHPAAALPTLPSRYPELSGPLWALPALAERALLSTAETELRGLVRRLAADAFSGALVLEALRTPEAANGADNSPAAPGDSDTLGFLLFQEGRLGGAACATGTQMQVGSPALRTLLQLGAALTLQPLPEPVVAALLGWLLGLQLSDTSSGTASGEVPEGFSGLELSPAGARYYHVGSAYLHLPRPAGIPADSAVPGLFAACQRAPSLALPSEPHGWEGRSYGLTLRGRDALNPMTELSMRFRSDFGPTGRRTLEVFRRELSVEAAAEALRLEPGALVGTAKRLEQEGFIRAVGGVTKTADYTLGDTSPTRRLQPR